MKSLNFKMASTGEKVDFTFAFYFDFAPETSLKNRHFVYMKIVGTPEDNLATLRNQRIKFFNKNLGSN